MKPQILSLAIALVLDAAVAPPADAGRRDSTSPQRSSPLHRDRNDVSPARDISPPLDRNRSRKPQAPAVEVRSLDGSGNHPFDPERNAILTPLARIAAPDYGDGSSTPAGANRPGARVVSNVVSAQPDLIPNPYGTSDYLWQWGQFVDHDIDLSEGADPPEPAPIPVPLGDPYFDPAGTGSAFIPMNRTIYAPGTGIDPGSPREQLNEVTGWIDASNVYGSDAARALALRSNDGSGRLATGPGNLLPDDDGTLPNATGGSSQPMFVAGDVRANEQVGLTALHTLFVREHNRLADRIRAADPRLDGDAVYERARKLVGALMQVITYQEFLPALLGPDALEPYRGYDPRADATILNEFSTAAYRFGHSALSPRLQRLDARLREIASGHLDLRDAFFNPDLVRNEGGIDPILRGLAHQQHQRIDAFLVDAVRNFLFGPPGQGGFDLASLNIQRGRDHGLPAYDDVREAYGLARLSDFDELTSDPEVQDRLAAVYASIDDVDLWVGGLCEDPVGHAQVGPLFFEILVAQFTALRDGDRFWYERDLDAADLELVRGTRLSDVIRRNTGIRGEIPDDVFRVSRTSRDASRRERRSRR